MPRFMNMRQGTVPAGAAVILLNDVPPSIVHKLGLNQENPFLKGGLFFLVNDLDPLSGVAVISTNNNRSDFNDPYVVVSAWNLFIP